MTCEGTLGERIEVPASSPRAMRARSSERERRQHRDTLWALQHRKGWSIPKIASVAGVDRTTVYRRLRAMGVEVEHARRLGESA